MRIFLQCRAATDEKTGLCAHHPLSAESEHPGSQASMHQIYRTDAVFLFLFLFFTSAHVTSKGRNADAYI